VRFTIHSGLTRPTRAPDNPVLQNKLHLDPADLRKTGKRNGLDKSADFWDHPP
jgi:hypothetical protein